MNDKEITLASDQIEAFKLAVHSNIMILTGGPGTGKTVLVKTIVENYKNEGLDVVLAAPTGKAGKRLYETTGYMASTIHMLLEPKKAKKGFYFTRNKENPIEADVIVLDELSMIDVSLMASFIDAVKPTTRLIFVGDSDQLPSVGPGNVLKDLISSKMIPTAELTIIKRQDEGLIVKNCHNIKNGKDIVCEDSVNRDFIFVPRDTQQSICSAIVEIVANRLPNKHNVDPVKDVQVISALREKTDLSCRALNSVLQTKLNKNPKIEGIKYKVGDKVIQTKNEYDKDIINGDIGYIRSINLDEKLIYVDFENPERKAKIPINDNNLELAYCCTCHKYQGSEAPIIVIPIHKCFGPLIMQRNWLYTAISRAKKLCILVGQRDEVPKIIKRNHQQRRFTHLERFLREKAG
nr:hypothetical protein 1 [Elusimicrobiota bacterium]